MVIRLWTEPGVGIRARITMTSDVESGRSTTTSYAASRAEVLGIVQGWLDEAALPSGPGQA